MKVSLGSGFCLGKILLKDSPSPKPMPRVVAAIVAMRTVSFKGISLSVGTNG